MPKCSNCGALIWWGVTDSGARMPVNHAQHDKGTIVLDRDAPKSPHGPRIRVLKGHEINQPLSLFGDAEDVPRYKHHRASCPFASKWRKT